jgi:hypothetical protein
MAYGDPDIDPNIQPLRPPLNEEPAITALDERAVDEGLNRALADLDKLAINVAPNPEVVESIASQHVEAPTYGNDPYNLLSNQNVETGVVSAEPQTQNIGVVDDEAPTPVPSGLSNAGQINFKKLDQAHKQNKRELKAALQREQLKEQEINQLRQQVQYLAQTGVVPPQIEQELTQLREFKDIFGVENNSELVKKYDQAVVATSHKISEVLAKRGMPITRADALEAATKTKTNVGTSIEDLVNVGYENLDWAYWDSAIFPNVSSIEKRIIEDSLMSILNIKEQRQAEIQTAVAKRKEYLQNAEQIRAQELAQEQSIVYGELEQYYKIAPWAKRIDPKGVSDPGKIAAITAHNQNIDRYETLFVAAYNAKTIKERVQVAAMSVLCERQIMEIKALRNALEIVKGENQKLKAKIEGVKAATTVRQNTVNTPKDAKPAVNDYSGLRDDQVIELRMKEMGL